MIQAPAWLPYRLRHRLDQSRIEQALRPVDRTPPMPAADPAKAAAELYMLLCRRDLYAGVLAIKSLLRFTKALAVTVTSDGTLRDDERAWVSRHVPGVRWLAWDKTSAACDLAGWPRLQQLYHSDYAPVCKLVHPMRLSRCERVIVLDPDTAFFQPPDTLLHWMHEDLPMAWYLHDHQDEAAAVPAMVEEAFAELAAMHHGDWLVRHRLFNSGLLACRPADLSLDHAEQYLAWLEAAPPQYREGKAAIWFGTWTPEQTCYHVMLARSQAHVQPLGDDYHLGGDAGHVFNHFLRHYLVQAPTLSRLRALIATWSSTG